LAGIQEDAYVKSSSPVGVTGAKLLSTTEGLLRYCRYQQIKGVYRLKLWTLDIF